MKNPPLRVEKRKNSTNRSQNRKQKHSRNTKHSGTTIYKSFEQRRKFYVESKNPVAEERDLV